MLIRWRGLIAEARDQPAPEKCLARVNVHILSEESDSDAVSALYIQLAIESSSRNQDLDALILQSVHTALASTPRRSSSGQRADTVDAAAESAGGSALVL